MAIIQLILRGFHTTKQIPPQNAQCPLDRVSFNESDSDTKPVWNGYTVILTSRIKGFIAKRGDI
jgi:hypothetical protein